MVLKGKEKEKKKEKKRKEKKRKEKKRKEKKRKEKKRKEKKRKEKKRKEKCKPYSVGTWGINTSARRRDMLKLRRDSYMASTEVKPSWMTYIKTKVNKRNEPNQTHKEGKREKSNTLACWE